MQSTTPPYIQSTDSLYKYSQLTDNLPPNVLLYNDESGPDNINITVNNTGYVIYGIFHAILTLIAVYLTWKCNNGKFDLVSFLISLIFPYVYIIYVLATKGTCKFN